jgi:hypothetical protein
MARYKITKLGGLCTVDEMTLDARAMTNEGKKHGGQALACQAMIGGTAARGIMKKGLHLSPSPLLRTLPGFPAPQKSDFGHLIQPPSRSCPCEIAKAEPASRSQMLSKEQMHLEPCEAQSDVCY